MNKGRIPGALLALIVMLAAQKDWLGLRTAENRCRYYRKAGARSRGDNVGGHSPGTMQRRRRSVLRRKG